MNNNIKIKKGKHLTFEDRLKIEVLRKRKLSSKEISGLLDRSERTVRRDLSIGEVELYNTDLTTRIEYSADLAQKRHNERQERKGRTLKIGNDHAFASYIERSIGKEKMSPYAALQRAKNDDLRFATHICVKTLYNYIDRELFLSISNKDLPVKKEKKKRKYDRVRKAYNNLKGCSITERPPDIDTREQYGHWEMDTVVGASGTTAALLVLTERKLNKEFVYKIKNKSQDCVVARLNRIERKLGAARFRMIFKTITCDNGCENLDFKGIEKSVYSSNPRTKVYYAHPYSAWERGTNENANKLVRRFIPKGMDISTVSTKTIAKIMEWINNYPRKKLGGLSSAAAEERLALQGVITLSQKCWTI